MSLVNYASSSEDEEVGEDQRQHSVDGCEERREGKSESDLSAAVIAPLRFPCQTKTESSSSTHLPRNVAMPSPALYMEKLPDASVLFSSSSFSQHQCICTDNHSCKAASMAESVSRKREPSGLSFIQPQNNKHPRGNLPHSRNIPDIVRGSLIPPQLKGRQNVVINVIQWKNVVRAGESNNLNEVEMEIWRRHGIEKTKQRNMRLGEDVAMLAMPSEGETEEMEDDELDRQCCAKEKGKTRIQRRPCLDHNMFRSTLPDLDRQSRAIQRRLCPFFRLNKEEGKTRMLGKTMYLPEDAILRRLQKKQW